MFRLALEGFEKELGAEAQPTLDAAKGLGATYAMLGMLDEAEEFLERALQGLNKVVGPEHSETIWTGKTLCDVYERQGKATQAEELMNECRRTSLKHIMTFFVNALVLDLGGRKC